MHPYMWVYVHICKLKFNIIEISTAWPYRQAEELREMSRRLEPYELQTLTRPYIPTNVNTSECVCRHQMKDIYIKYIALIYVNSNNKEVFPIVVAVILLLSTFCWAHSAWARKKQKTKKQSKYIIRKLSAY